MALSVPSLVRAHWLFAGLLVIGVVFRIVTLFAYDPALFSPDSRVYLQQSHHLRPSPLWPIGYPVFLRVLPLSQGFVAIALVQHLLGLAAAAVTHALLLRLRVHAWLAALAVAPILLDAYQLNVEEYVLSEALFDLFVIGGAAVLLWRGRIGSASAALAGLLFAGAALTRAIGFLVFVPAFVAVVLLAGRPLRTRLAPVLAFVAVAVVSLGGYALWYHSLYGSYALAGDTGRRIYGRVVPWVECDDLSVPAYERVLCPKDPPGKRKRVFLLMWSKDSPINRVEVPRGTTRTAVASDFARRAIRQQLLGYARAVGGDFLTSFALTRHARGNGHRAEQWRFQTRFPIPGYPASWSTAPPQSGDDGQVRAGPARFLRSYQVAGYVPGPLLALGALVALVAVIGVGSAARSGLRTATFLLLGLYVALCVGPLLIAPFSWRYQLPQLLLIPPAAALGLTALFDLRGRSGQPAS